MTRPPHDFSRCLETPENTACPLAARCLRRLDPGPGKHQALKAYPGGKDCRGFIGIEQED